MKAIVLAVVDSHNIFPDECTGANVVNVRVEVQYGSKLYVAAWPLGQIEARMVEITPTLSLESR